LLVVLTFIQYAKQIHQVYYCILFDYNHMFSVDYSWDDLYAEKLIKLQVFENRSHTYDPKMPCIGPALIYDNDIYIKLISSFTSNS
jgi:hypothetical protein